MRGGKSKLHPKGVISVFNKIIKRMPLGNELAKADEMKAAIKKKWQQLFSIIATFLYLTKNYIFTSTILLVSIPSMSTTLIITL